MPQTVKTRKPPRISAPELALGDEFRAESNQPFEERLEEDPIEEEPLSAAEAADESDPEPAPAPPQPRFLPSESGAFAGLSRMQLNHLLTAAGSHPATLAAMLEKAGGRDEIPRRILIQAKRIELSAKEEKLLELLRRGGENKTLVFANFRATLARLQKLLTKAGIAFSLFTGEETAREKDAAVEEFRTRAPVMLCSESGGEGRNLQFANTLINYDLPWNPMRIEQRVGRIHRIGQTREVFIFNLCTAGSLEDRILRVLNDKVRMFELVVGEVGSILGNLEGGEEFESLVLDLWLKSRTGAELDAAFDQLGSSLLEAQEEYVRAKELDEALFGDDYE